MTIQEFSEQFDTLFNNITSNQAPGLDEFEKSVFLTKAEKEIVKDYFTAKSKGNSLGQGFDDSAKRQADFSVLMKTAQCTEYSALLCTYDGEDKTVLSDTVTLTTHGGDVVAWNTVDFGADFEVDCELDSQDNKIYLATLQGAHYYVTGFPFTMHEADAADMKKVTIGEQIDSRSFMYSFPKDTFIIINEAVTAKDGTMLQVIPLRYDEYMRLMSKPFKRPLKYQAWRLMNSASIEKDTDVSETDEKVTKVAELILGPGAEVTKYMVRYVRMPKPIILSDLDGLTIDGYSSVSDKCELDPILHEDILQRAVELAKNAWQGDVKSTVELGTRSE